VTHFHRLLVCVALMMVAGCVKREPAPPVLLPAKSITARLHSVPELGIQAIEHVEVPDEELSHFLRLVTPQQFVTVGVRPSTDYHVADVYLHHDDSKVTEITVRWMGHNPAAVTIDGSDYFFASTDDFPDGAIRIARLLAEFNFRSGHR
jgi:hypothetical protein